MEAGLTRLARQADKPGLVCVVNFIVKMTVFIWISRLACLARSRLKLTRSRLPEKKFYI